MKLIAFTQSKHQQNCISSDKRVYINTDFIVSIQPSYHNDTDTMIQTTKDTYFIEESIEQVMDRLITAFTDNENIGVWSVKQ